MYFVFFFQAEDGIRDGHVTGVQTCALPIYRTRTFNFSPSNNISINSSNDRSRINSFMLIKSAIFNSDKRFLNVFRNVFNHNRISSFFKKFTNYFRSEEHTSELQSRGHLVCRLLLEKKKKQKQ